MGVAIHAGFALFNVIQERLAERRGGATSGSAVLVEVHLKQGFAAWKEKFDGDAANRAAMCDEARTQCGAASEEVAMVALHAVDLRKFSALIADEDFAKMVAPVVSTHVPFLMEALPGPA